MSIHRRWGLVPLLGALLMVGGCQGHPDLGMIDRLIDEARHTLASDSRTAVFDVGATLESDAVVLNGEVQDEYLHSRLIAFIKERYAGTLIDKLTVLPAASLHGKTYGVVSISVANLRTKPDHPAEMGTQAIMGTPLRVLKKSHGWLLVQTPDGYLGWSDDEITTMDSATFAAWHRAAKVIVTSAYGFTHEKASADAPVVSDIVVGGIFELKGQLGAFWEVAYPDGRSAYLARTDAVPFDTWLAGAQDTPDRIIATARRFVGVPYLWGGTSAKGLDCSGFTKTVFFLNGVILPRDAGQQAVVGIPIATDSERPSLQPGDLLFFGTKASGTKPARVTHVGLSLGGRRFIHESGYVRVNSLDPVDSDYSHFRDEGFLWARRMIGASADHGVVPIAQSLYTK